MTRKKPKPEKPQITTDEAAERFGICMWLLTGQAEGVSMSAESGIVDWTNIRADLIPQDALYAYLKAFGQQSIPTGIIAAVCARPKPVTDSIQVSSQVGDILIAADYEAKVASNFVYALNLMSAALENADDRDAVGQLCDEIDDRLQAIRGKLDFLTAAAQAA